MVLPGTQLLFFSPAKWQISQGKTTPMSMELTFSVLTASLHNPCQGFPNPSQIWNVKLNISVAHLSRVWMKASTHSFCLALLGGCLFVYWFVLIFSPQSQTSSSIALLYRSSRIYVALECRDAPDEGPVLHCRPSPRKLRDQCHAADSPPGL